MPVQQHNLTNILQAVPRLLEVLPWAALLSCSRNLRCLIKRSTQKLTVHQSSRQFARLDGDWPELCLIIVAEQIFEDTMCWYLFQAHSKIKLLTLLILEQDRKGCGALVVCSQNTVWHLPSLAVQNKHAAIAYEHLHKTEWQHATKMHPIRNRLGKHSIAQLSARSWPSLVELNFDHYRASLDAASMAHLAEGVWPSLSKLDLSSTNVNADGILSLSEGHWPSLQELCLGGKPRLCMETLELIFKSQAWPMLFKLSLRDMKIDTACSGNVPFTMACLQALTVHSTPLDAKIVAVFVRAPWPCLTALTLSNTGLGQDEIGLLVTASLPALSTLDLERNKLALGAAQHLRRSEWPQLATLVLSENYLDDCAMSYIAMGQWPNLHVLQLADNCFQVQGLRVLTAGKWPMLHSLTLSRSLNIAATHVLLDLKPCPEHGGFQSLTQSMYMSRVAEPLPGMVWPELIHVEFAPEYVPHVLRSIDALGMAMILAVVWLVLVAMFLFCIISYLGG